MATASRPLSFKHAKNKGITLKIKKRFYDSLKTTVLISFSFQHSLIKIETKYM